MSASDVQGDHHDARAYYGAHHAFESDHLHHIDFVSVQKVFLVAVTKALENQGKEKRDDSDNRLDVEPVMMRIIVITIFKNYG